MGGYDMDPYSEMLGGARSSLAPLIAQILMQKKAMEAEQQERIADKSALFDPTENYRRIGANLPHLMGLSAMQRYRDMGLRTAAGADAVKAAVAAKQREQEQLAAVDPLAASGITKTEGPIVNGQPTETLRSKYGVGFQNIAPTSESFTIDGRKTSGGDLREFFQRAVNAGSPNSAAVGLAPEPGYQGVPMGSADEALWRETMRRVKS